MESPGSQQKTRVVSGRVVVIGMFAFGLSTTACLWIFWDRHTEPYRALEYALVTEFAGSRPDVQGGQRKMHEQSPRILRIVLRVAFDPEQNQQQAEQFARRVAAFVREQHDVSTYDTIEIRLYQPVPEREIKTGTIVIPANPVSEASPNSQAADKDSR
jgi:hypothetical protein